MEPISEKNISAAPQQLKRELKDSFNELTDRKLLALYNYTLKSEITLEELAEVYGTQVTRSREFSRVKARIRDEIRNDLINEILEVIERIPPQINENKPIKIEDVKLKPLPPKLKPEEVKLKRYDESEEYKSNQERLKQIQEEIKKREEEIKQLKIEFEKMKNEQMEKNKEIIKGIKWNRNLKKVYNPAKSDYKRFQESIYKDKPISYDEYKRINEEPLDKKKVVDEMKEVSSHPYE